MSQQLSLFDDSSVSESKTVSITSSVSEKQRLKYQAIQRYLDTGERENIPHVNTYRVKNTNNRYYRLSYRSSGKVKHVHIPGGNTYSELASYRASKLRELIDRGAELAEVLAMTRDFRNGAK